MFPNLLACDPVQKCSIWLGPLILFPLSIVIWSTMELFIFLTSQIVLSRSMLKAQKSKTKMFHPMNHLTVTPDLSSSDLWSCVGVHSYLKLIFKTRYNPSHTLMISISWHLYILWYVNHRGWLLNSEYFILLVYSWRNFNNFTKVGFGMENIEL